MFFEEVREYAGTDRGDETLRDLITRLLVWDGEDWSDVERIIVRTSGRFAENLDAPEDIKREVASLLEIEEPCDVEWTLDGTLADYLLDVPGSSTVAMSDAGAKSCRFIVYTPRRVFGNNNGESGRASVVSVPRHPEED
jgi:hypothetical protein